MTFNTSVLSTSLLFLSLSPFIFSVTACSPPYSGPQTSQPTRISLPQDTRVREQEISICENRVQETMKSFVAKNPEDNEANRRAEDELYAREQSVCNRLRESYGMQANPTEGSWGSNVPDAPGYGGYENNMARDMLTGAAIGAGATYMLNRNRRNHSYYDDRSNPNRYGSRGYDDTRYQNSQNYQRPAPTYRPSRSYGRTRGVFRGRRR